MPALCNGDIVLLVDGSSAKLLSTDYRTMIVRLESGSVREVSIAAYRGLLVPAGFDADETQECVAVESEGN